MSTDRERVEALVMAVCRHQRVPTYADSWSNKCSGCDNLHGATDGPNSPRHVEHQIRVLLDSPAMRDLLAEAKADAWDEGYEARVGFMELRNETRAENNPYRETSKERADD